MSPKLVKIVPHTRHLENRATQHGYVWEVIVENDTTGKVLVRSLDMTFRTPSGRMEHDLRWLNRGEFVRL